MRSNEVITTVGLDELAAKANQAHERALKSASTTVDYAIACGEALNAAKAQIEHGQFMKWLDENFQGSQRIAQQYMRAARNPEKIQGAAGIREAIAMLTTSKNETDVSFLGNTFATGASEPVTESDDSEAYKSRSHEDGINVVENRGTGSDDQEAMAPKKDPQEQARLARKLVMNTLTSASRYAGDYNELNPNRTAMRQFQDNLNVVINGLW